MTTEIMIRKTEIARAWLPLPPTSNNAYINTAHGRAKSEALKTWEDEAGWYWRAKGQMLRTPVDARTTWGWSGTFYFPTLAQRDLDNCYKHIGDVIVRVVFGGRPDDRLLVWDEHWKLVSRVDPGVYVRVYEVPHGDMDR